MHAITLLSSGALIGTIVGYAIARCGPQLSSVSNEQDTGTARASSTPDAVSTWIDRIRSRFIRCAKAPTSPVGLSGNQAFDAYREATLQRLEDEEHAFVVFLERLRKAEDKETFDSFLADKPSKHQEHNEADRD
ncbi:MAG: DUF2852 domain-containing protein [Hyphomicrobiaceae bacterium]